MAAASPPRLAALQVLRALRAGDLLDRATTRLTANVSSRDQAWSRELLYGVCRLRGRLDYLLAQLVRGGLDSLQPDVLDVLRLGAYQLLEMGSVPPYAAVSQSVELARAAGAGRAAGLVNGVLNSLQRQREKLEFPDLETEPAEFLSAWGSHPRWLVDRWLARWGAVDTRALVEADNTRPELFIRPLGRGVEQARAALGEAGVETEAVGFSPDSLRVLPPATAAQALAAAPAVVQDPAAALVVRYAAPEPGSLVLDLCSAPGGKALGLADSAGFVAAADVSPGRLGRVRENVERVGLGDRIGLVAADARHPPFRPADLVLLDAPCSGTGTLRRHPDGRWRIDLGELEALVLLQRELLEAAIPLVRPGGLLVYATCSLEPEENEEQVRAFMGRHPEFTVEPPAGMGADVLDEHGFLRVLPQRHGCDGSFAARLRRTQ